jgi:hypothetical protein
MDPIQRWLAEPHDANDVERALRAVLDEIDNSVDRDRTLPGRIRAAIAKAAGVEL